MIPRSLPALLLLLLSLSPPPSLSEDSAAGKKKKMDALLQEQFCKNFTVGKPRESEFYSPGHPGDYPPDITCFRTLTADIGYFVRVDFRDMFKLEPKSTDGMCEYDYLEIRDGEHGYSPLIGEGGL